MSDYDSDDNEAHFFAAYEYVSGDWASSTLPKDWWSPGSGGTTNKDYPHEVQFTGPFETVGAAKKEIKKCLEKMLKSGVVKRFKIVDCLNDL